MKYGNRLINYSTKSSQQKKAIKNQTVELHRKKKRAKCEENSVLNENKTAENYTDTMTIY